MNVDRRQPGGDRNGATPWLIAVGLFLLALAIGGVVAVALLAEDRDLTSLEVALFSTLELLLSVSGSVIIADYVGRRRGKAIAMALARPALRRVVELKESASLIDLAVSDTTEQMKGVEELSVERVRDWNRSLQYLLTQHRGQLGAAIEDWQELLPHEYQHLLRVAELERKLTEALGELQAARTEDVKTVRTLKRQVDELTDELGLVRSSARITASDILNVRYTNLTSLGRRYGLSSDPKLSSGKVRIEPDEAGASFIVHRDDKAKNEDPPDTPTSK